MPYVCSGCTFDKIQITPTNSPATTFYGGLTASDEGGGLNGVLVETFGSDTSGVVTSGLVIFAGGSALASAGGAILLAFNKAERSTSAPLRMSSASVSAACETGQHQQSNTASEAIEDDMPMIINPALFDAVSCSKAFGYMGENNQNRAFFVYNVEKALVRSKRFRLSFKTEPGDRNRGISRSARQSDISGSVYFFGPSYFNSLSQNTHTHTKQHTFL